MRLASCTELSIFVSKWDSTVFTDRGVPKIKLLCVTLYTNKSKYEDHPGAGGWADLNAFSVKALKLSPPLHAQCGVL